MTVDDIAVDSHTSLSCLQLTIKASKTDPFRKGCCLYIGLGRPPLCAREVCRGIAMCFCWSCVAGVARLACLLAFPSLPPTFLGKYQFHTLVFPVQCCVDRCLEVGCGSVAMVTSLLLRRLLPSSVATFKAPTPQYSIGLEFNSSKGDSLGLKGLKQTIINQCKSLRSTTKKKTQTSY